jgi:hypothetical protein
MSFIFFVVSTVASAIVEAISGLVSQRSTGLEKWLCTNISDDPAVGKEQAKAILDSPIVYGLTVGARRPSYIPSEYFLAAVLSQGGTAAVTGARTAEELATSTQRLITSLPDGPIKRALSQLWNEANGDVNRFEKAAKHWFDSAMDRVSGWYKRWSQKILWVIGLIVAAVLNIDALHVGQVLWHDPTIRQVLADQGSQAAHGTSKLNLSQATDAAKHLPLPIGWTEAYAESLDAAGWVREVAGIVATAAAVSLGAPFWFDALGKLANLRNSGNQPVPAQTKAAASA